MKRTYPVIAIFALLAALAVAGCGGGSNSSSSGEGSSASSGEGSSASSGEGAYGSSEEGASAKSASSQEAGQGEAATLAVKSLGGEVGSVLVDSKGFTLYLFKKDKGGKSACYGACAAGWPPLTTEGAPKGMSGVQASKLGTTKRNDGTTQVTYAGWPLYTFVEDKKPGEANGEDVSAFGAQWYALHANGEQAGH